MKQTKLFTMLAALSKPEFSRLGKFLHSPYYNDSHCNISLFEFLKPYYPLFRDAQFTKEAIFQSIYPDEPYNDAKLRDRCTHLLKLVKTFLAVEKYNASSFDINKNKISALLEKGFGNMLENEFNDAFKYLQDQQVQDETYYLNKYQLLNLRRQSEDLIISKRNEVYNDIQEEIDAMIHFFLIALLKEYSYITDTMRHVNIDHEYKFIESIIDHVSGRGERYKDNAFINVYGSFFHIYKSKPDPTLILKIRDLLFCYKDRLQKDIFNNLFIELYNQTKRWQSQGVKEMGSVSFKLTEDMLQFGVLLKEDGKMTAHTYTNIVATAVRDNYIDWAEQFIRDYIYQVKPREQKNAYFYNMAVLWYMKGYGKDYFTRQDAYDKSIECLQKVKSEDFYYMTRIKNHELKVFYETGKYDKVLSLIDSYHHFLKRNTIMTKHLKERYHNFIIYLQQLVKLMFKPDQFLLEKLNKDIQNNSHTEYKGWLLEQIRIQS